MHSLAMHADPRTSKGLISPKIISGRNSPGAMAAHHHSHHPHLVMPHAAHPLHAHHVLHHQHPNPYSSLNTSLSLPPTTESSTSSPTSTSHAHNSSSSSSLANNIKYDLTSNHHQGGNVNSPVGGANPHSGSSSHHSHSQQQQQQPPQSHQHLHHDYSQFGSTASVLPNVKSETQTPSTSNYDYMSQCYFGGGSVPAVSSAAPSAGFSNSISSSAVASPHATDLVGYHHQHNVIQAAKLMASS